MTAGSVQWYVAANNAPKTTTGGFASITATATGMTTTFYDQVNIHATANNRH